MSQEFEIKRLSLEEQRDRLQQQLDNLKEELSAKLNMANQEVPERVRFGSAREAPRKHPPHLCDNPSAGLCRCPTSRSW